MTLKTIETRAIISAQDKTGATFAQVAQKLRGLEATAMQASRRVDSMARGMSDVWIKQQQHLDVARRMASSVAPGPGFWERNQAARERAIQTGLTIGAASAVAAPIVKEIVKQAQAQLHENIRMSNAGMSEGEIAEANAKAMELAGKYRSVRQADIMHMLRNQRASVGSYEEAARVSEPLLKLRVLEQHAHPNASTEEINESFDKLIKAAELAGTTQDIDKFRNYIEGIAKAINVFGDTIKPYEFFEAAQYGRAATMGYSPEFVAGVLPTIIQHHGGAQAGTAGGSFYSAIIGGRMQKMAAEEMVRLGLVDPNKVVYTSTGSVKGIMPGGVYGSDLAISDPDKWVQTYLKKALDKAGITEPRKVQEEVAHLFSNRVAGQFVAEQLTQHGLYEKDRAMTHGAPGTAAVRKIIDEDFGMAASSLKAKVDDLAAAAGRPFLQPLTDGINVLSETAARAAKVFSDYPTVAKEATGAGVVGTALTGYLGIKGAQMLLGGASAGLPLPSLATAGLFGAAAFGASAIYNRNAIYGGLMNKSAADIANDKAEMHPWIKSNFRMPWELPEAPHEAGSSVFKRMRALKSTGASAEGEGSTPVRLEGSANIGLKVEVSPSPDFVVKVEQQINAHGNLSGPTGVSMAPGQ